MNVNHHHQQISPRTVTEHTPEQEAWNIQRRQSNSRLFIGKFRTILTCFLVFIYKSLFHFMLLKLSSLKVHKLTFSWKSAANSYSFWTLQSGIKLTNGSKILNLQVMLYRLWDTGWCWRNILTRKTTYTHTHTHTHVYVGPDSSVGIATSYGLHCPLI